MQHDANAKIEQLQHTVDKLALRVDQLTRRLDSIQNAPTAQPKPTISPADSTTPPKLSIPEQSPATKIAAQQTAPISPPLHYQSQPIKAPKRETRSNPHKFNLSKLEWLLGIKGLMLLGVVIVIIGIGMFLKLATDEGWIRAIPPAARCGSAAIFGILLVGLGEFLRKKINPLASSGFTAAGIATMYAAIYAASRMYNLFGPEIAFSLLALVSIVGVVLGALSNRVFLSLLSLLGAFAVPILLATDSPSSVILPGYLLFLLAMGLVLSGIKGGDYSHARRLAWWGTGFIGSLWLATMYDQSPVSSLVFITLAWLLTIIELAASSRFFGSLRSNINWQSSCLSGFIKSDTGEITFNPLSLFSREARWINSLFGTTIWSVIATGLVINQLNPDLVYIAPLAFGLLSVLIIFASMRIGINPFKSIAAQTASPASLMSSALLINAAMLLVATIAIAFGGWIEVVAWLAVGMGGIETARRFRFRAVGIFGLSLMAFGILRLLSYDFAQYYDSDPTFQILGIAFTPWAAQLLIASTAFAAASWRSRYPFERNTTAPVALWLLVACPLHADTIGSSHASTTLMISAAACWFSIKTPLKSLRTNAFVLAGVAMSTLCIAQVYIMALIEGQFELDIQVIPMLIAAFAWACIAALPKGSYILRLLTATLVVISLFIALGKIEAVSDIPTMLLAHAVLVSAIVLLSKRFFAWSLCEIASVASITLMAGWTIYLLGRNEDIFHLAPLSSMDSLAPIAILAAMIYSARTITTRNIPTHASEDLNLVSSRRKLRNFLYGIIWLFTLVATSLEVIRATNMFFESDSAHGAAISIWWSMYAVASVSLGLKLPRQLRWAGLTLLCLVGAKVLLLDTMTLAPGARIIASITVGLIIITTGVVYSRVVGKLNQSADDLESQRAPDNND